MVRNKERCVRRTATRRSQKAKIRKQQLRSKSLPHITTQENKTGENGLYSFQQSEFVRLRVNIPDSRAPR